MLDGELVQCFMKNDATLIVVLINKRNVRIGFVTKQFFYKGKNGRYAAAGSNEPNMSLLCGIGFNNEPVTSLVTPGISSVDQPAFELGKVAAKLFIETVHNNGDMSEVDEVLKPKLIVRESSQRILPKGKTVK